MQHHNFGDGYATDERSFVLKVPRPVDALPPRNSTIEQFVHVTRRYRGSYHGFDFVCGFCGLRKKATSAQAWCHLAQRSLGGTHCQPCLKVPQEIVSLLLKERELSEAKNAQKAKRCMIASAPKTQQPQALQSSDISANDVSFDGSRHSAMAAVELSVQSRSGFVLRIPRPPNALPSRKGTVEEYLYIMRRYQGGSFHGFDFICGFCGFVKKSTTAQAWCHLAKRSWGQTHCQPCLAVPEALSAILLKEREETDAKKAEKRKRKLSPHDSGRSVADVPLDAILARSIQDTSLDLAVGQSPAKICRNEPAVSVMPDSLTSVEVRNSDFILPDYPLKLPEPSNTLPSRKNTVEKYLYIMRRYQGSFHGFDFVCGFCGLTKKSTTAQAWCHLTRKSRGATHCQPCAQVPPELSALLLREREEAGARKAQTRKNDPPMQEICDADKLDEQLRLQQWSSTYQPSQFRDFSDVYN